VSADGETNGQTGEGQSRSPFDVDPSFRAAGDKARQRQQFRDTGKHARKRRLRRRIRRYGLLGGGGTVALIAALIVWRMVAGPSEYQYSGDDGAQGVDDDFVMVQTDDAEAEEQVSSFTPVLPVDIQVDPMILRLAEGSADSLHTIAGPEDFLPERIGPQTAERIAWMKEPLVVPEQRLELVLPSSGDDFALFQAQRNAGAASPPVSPQVRAPQAPVEAGEVVAVDEDSSWGDLIATDEDALMAEGQSEGAAVYVETRIANTTSTVLALRESERVSLYEDAVTVTQTERPLQDVLKSNRFSEEVAAAIVKAAGDKLQIPETLAPASIVALRFREEDGTRQLLQMSVYAPDGYIGTLVRLGEGRFDSGADPWFAENLIDRTSEFQAQAQEAKEIRLIDAIYSTAIRNGLPQTLVGQMIVILSKDFDLDRFAGDGDQMTVLYATNPGPKGEGLGRVLYVAIEGPSGKFNCYVTESDNDAGYACFDFNATSGAGSVSGGILVPVKGVKTSGFGPRHHPILKQVRNHNGVDWAAPTGTPISAAMDGTVDYAGPGGGYGNVIYVGHAGGVQTRYAHMSKYGPFKKGDRVKAGDIIGYVGTTGRSTGPHLHFELLVNGTPVDPLSFQAEVRVARAGPVSDGGQPGSAAVEALVNQIIKVESAGNARAKNPLSSATGLGQFISSTWIRMMNDYRPDLARSMSRQELLDLRFDPALSREMVRNLAREGEAYLRARGHPIRPGTLYLCHFLGAGGAAKALSANPDQLVVDAMGAGVVNANPFLRGKTVGWMINWSDNKMRPRGTPATTFVASSSAPAAMVVPAEVKSFKEAIDTILKEV
jgi:murein DD-endopeptidase MepM/ murein hydrolase activator NlpD